MMDQVHQNLRFTQLDAHLLSTPYKVQTNWHVITGAPCCGKTTLVELLAQHGYHTVPEVARAFIKEETASGQTTHPIFLDAATLQRKIKDLQLDLESRLPTSELLFLDGALPSSLAWFRVFGMDPNECLPECFLHRYASAIILAPLQFQEDEERPGEIMGIRNLLDEWLMHDYRSLGYEVVRVPVLPPNERLAYVLERLGAPTMTVHPA